MNETERQALVDELAEAMWLSERDYTEGHEWHGDVRETGIGRMILREATACLPIIDRLLAAAAAPEPGLDELLDSVHEGACIRNMYSHKGRSSVTVGVPIERPSGGWSGYIEHIATGATRMDAIRSAVAQATATQEGGQGDG